METASYFEMTIAGVGGQGALILGRLLVEAAASMYKYVSFFPSYSGAMRGGESECTVILSNKGEISSPAIFKPSSVVLMGPAPLAEFEARVKPGGMIVLDSSWSAMGVTRKDLEVISIPASRLAAELGNADVGNFMLLGAYLKATKAIPLELLEQTLEKKLSGGKWAALLALDKQALRAGYDWAQETGC